MAGEITEPTERVDPAYIDYDVLAEIREEVFAWSQHLPEGNGYWKSRSIDISGRDILLVRNIQDRWRALNSLLEQNPHWSEIIDNYVAATSLQLIGEAELTRTEENIIEHQGQISPIVKLAVVGAIHRNKLNRDTLANIDVNDQIYLAESRGVKYKSALDQLSPSVIITCGMILRNRGELKQYMILCGDYKKTVERGMFGYYRLDEGRDRTIERLMDIFQGERFHAIKQMRRTLINIAGSGFSRAQATLESMRTRSKDIPIAPVEPVNLATMTDDQLRGLLEDIQAELADRHLADGELPQDYIESDSQRNSTQ